MSSLSMSIGTAKCHAQRRSAPTPRAFGSQTQQSRTTRVHAGTEIISQAESIQLASAKLPKATNVDAFTSGMYQWASTLTSSGQNLPFALPLQADKTENGFNISFLRNKQGEIVRIAKIESTVEQYGEDNVLMVRFRAGPQPFPDGRVPNKPEKELLSVLLDSMTDVPLLMSTMSGAISKVASASLDN